MPEEFSDGLSPLKDIQSYMELILGASLSSLCHYRMHPRKCAKLKDRDSKFLGYFWKLLWKMNSLSLKHNSIVNLQKSFCVWKFQKTRGRVFSKRGRLMRGSWMSMTAYGLFDYLEEKERTRLFTIFGGFRWHMTVHEYDTTVS